MPLIVDTRERELIRLLPPVYVKVEALAVADVLVLDYDGHVALAIERKSAADFRASLRDGRYAEQRSRMVEAYGQNAVYVVEDDGEALYEGDLAGAVTGLLFRHRIVTVRVRNIAETVAFLGHVADAALKGRLVPGISPPQSNLAKRRATTAGELAANMLATVPGVSTRVADELVARYSTLAGIAAVARTSGLADEKIGGRRLGKVGDRLSQLLAQL